MVFRTALSIGAGLAIVSASCAGAATPVAVPSRQWTEDATAYFYNGALRLGWERPLGDWIDAAGVRHGNQPFASARLDREGVHDLDVTELVRAHGADFRVVGRLADVASREAGSGRPLLIVSGPSGSFAHEASQDVGMDGSTHESRGAAPSHKLSEGFFIAFDQPAEPSIERAILRLTVTKLWSGAAIPTQVYRPDPRPVRPAMPEVPVGSKDDVVLRIAGSAWKSGLGWAKTADNTRINVDGSLAAWIAPGSDTALSSIYTIPKAERRPLMCLRVEMTVHKDWTAPWGGKFPGLANTGQGDRADDPAGWGGRRADGTRWSARTNRYGHDQDSRLADDYMALGTYAYRVNADTSHGDAVPFAVPVPKGRKFTYDQCVGMNTPGRADGLVAYWVDGAPAGLLGHVVWRTSGGPETLPSEIWADIYEGGTGYGDVPHGRHTVTLHALTLSTKRLPFP